MVESADMYTSTLRLTSSIDHVLSVVAPDGAARSVKVRLASGAGQVLSYASYVKDIKSRDPVDQFLIASGGPDTGAALNAARSLVMAHPEFGFGNIIEAQRLLDSVGNGTIQAVKQTASELAIADVRSALATDPDSADVLLGAAKISVRLGDSATAVDLAQRAVSGDANSADGQYTLGSLLLQKGQADRALAALRRSIDLDPYAVSHYEALAQAYSAVGRGPDANTTKAVARALALRQGRDPVDPKPTKVLVTAAAVVLGAVLVSLLWWGRFTSREHRGTEGLVRRLGGSVVAGQAPSLLEFLFVMGAWTLVVPTVAPVFGVPHLSSARLEVSNYWIPGVTIVITSIVGRWWYFIGRPGKVWPLCVASVLFLCGLWMLVTHVGMARDVVLDGRPWGSLIHYAGVSVVVAATSTLLLYRIREGPQDDRRNDMVEGFAV
jgi:hypothetical protein